ncbi:MAG: ABC transporter substrate-binding protein [Lachnospiraceae bacterium]|nr:ABC transporter substrate-binding protein [Lachnospiraceae bacterium]
MKKKLLSILLVACMIMSMTACSKSSDTPATTDDATATPTEAASEETTTAPTEAETAEPTKEAGPAAGQIIIGDTTQSNGDVVPYWTNNASDYNVYNMTYGAETIAQTREGKFIVNPNVVENLEQTENADGTKTFTFKLKEDLLWSNGDPITAKDYVFATLFWSCKEVAEDLAASEAMDGYRFVGYDEFLAQTSKEFKGVRLLGDYEFSITVMADYLPYYYDLSMVQIVPYYMKGWVPADVDVLDDGNGAYFSDNFTADYIEPTVTAYRENNTAFAGPYTIESYDKTTNTYTLKANPNYAGNYEGQKPQIETVIYKYVLSETVMDELATGSIDLYCQAAEGTEINAGLDLVDQGIAGYATYSRNGYGKLVFVCDAGPTQFVEVRHAIAYLLDRNEFAKAFTGGFGTVVNGCYGTSQWMVEEAEDEVAALNTYAYSLDSAIKELEDGGWVLDENGDPYVSGIRYKKLDDGTLMPLVIEWCSSENNSVSDLLVTKLANNPDVAAAGMQINQTVMSFNELITYYTGEPGYHMFNMGVGFTAVFNMTQSYKIGGTGNYNRIADEELASLASDMVLVPAGDDEAFLAKWVKFEQRWNYLLPDLPLYSNEYHDFFTTRVKGYEDVNALWDVSSQIVYCTVED